MGQYYLFPAGARGEELIHGNGNALPPYRNMVANE